MREIYVISYLVGKEARPNGSSSFNWLATTHEGNPLSLHYDRSRAKKDLHWVEVCDPSKHLGIPTDSDGIVGIDIVDLPKYFKREVQ